MKRFLLAIFLLLGALFAANAQNRFVNSIEVSGVHSIIANPTISANSLVVSDVAGFNFGKYFIVGAGFGLGYCDGLMQDIYHYSFVDDEISDSGRMLDGEWLVQGLIRAGFVFPLSNFSPFLTLDLGYNMRTIDRTTSAKMLDGPFLEPAIGCKFDIKGHSFAVGVGYEFLSYEYEYVLTPVSSDDRPDYRTISAEALTFRLAYIF